MINPGQELGDFISDAGSVAVLTGAGVSTASGIPEYRDRDGNWKHAKPVQFADFVADDRVRQRYWARSFSGWQRMNGATPNAAHDALAALEDGKAIDTLITQNVDGLHHRAGSERVIDLHGRLDSVICLACDWRLPRTDWQARLKERNPNWQAGIGVIRPDGDVELTDVAHEDFDVPSCDICAGIVKPDVVFFGEAVPKPRVAASLDAVRRAGALLVVGSSLMVFSGFRFARLAVEIGKPIAIVNQGRTRADDMAHLKLDGDCGEMLTAAIDYLNLGERSQRRLQ